MLIHRTIILLLSCQWTRAIDHEKSSPPHDDATDQMAIQSENRQVIIDKGKIFIPSPTISSLTVDLMTDETRRISKNNEKRSEIASDLSKPIDEIGKIGKIDEIGKVDEIGKIDETDKIGKVDEIGKIDETDKIGKVDEIGKIDMIDHIDSDPAYSTEARMFLNLGGPSADRRSYDAQDGRSDFEILKIRGETPAIANYHEFYDNLRENLRGRDRQEEAIREEARNNNNNNARKTKDRIKEIEKYFTDFAGSNDGYYNNYGNAETASVQKEIFEPEKVQQASYSGKSVDSPYDIYDDRQSARQKPSSTFDSGFNDGLTDARTRYNNYQPAPKNRQVKPVVIVEPSDYKIAMNFGSQQQEVTEKIDNNKSPKHHRTAESTDKYEQGSRLNRQDRYGTSYERNAETTDYSEEGADEAEEEDDDDDDYAEVTEKPRRIHKSRRRPYGAERRLPKEHRGRNEQESNDARRNSSARSKLNRPKAAKQSPKHWSDDERRFPSSEESSNEAPSTTTKPDTRRSKKPPKSRVVTNWSQVGPNIEVSHSNGFEVDQIDKPKLLLPVNLNLLPLTNFDHSSAIGNSQGFDFSNVPNFVTSTPPILNGQSTVNPIGRNFGAVNSSPNQQPKNSNMETLLNNNYGSPNTSPDIIVGQNTYNNPVQAVLLSQMSSNNEKIAPNLRNTNYLPSTVTPIFTVTPANDLRNIQSTPSRVNNNNNHRINQNFQHFGVNPSATSAHQLFLPQPTIQTFSTILQPPYNGNSNIFINPNGLNGQNSPSATATTQQPITSNFNPLEMKKNIGPDNHGHFVTTASFSVGNEQQQNGQPIIGNDNKYYLSPNNQPSPNNNNNNNNNNNHHYYNGNENNQNSRVKAYPTNSQLIPALIHHTNSLPILNFNQQNYGHVAGQLQEQQSIATPVIVANRQREQSHQILNAANDIFQNTWKQLQRLRNTDQDGKKSSPYDNVYGINDNIGSTSNSNGNEVNVLPAVNVNSAQAQLPILPTQNVEIVNPNIKPSPVDLVNFNQQTYHHYPAAILTTPIPIFSSTTANFLTPDSIGNDKSANSLNLQNYVHQLTQIGAQQSSHLNKMENRPVTNKDNQRHVFNPINFVPNNDLMKSQTMLNSKTNEQQLPKKLNLVPLIPGGNFFKASLGAQTDLVKKPRLSSDLEKYAEEMFKESLNTIYSSHKWNNDRRLRGNYSSADLNELTRLNNDYRRFKASLPDPSYGDDKDLLEAHHSETNLRTADTAETPNKKKPDKLSMADIEQLFKSDFKLNLPISEPNKKNRPTFSSRPNSSNDHSGIKELTDYLTPPKLHSFLSKSPFFDGPKSGPKKRPNSASATRHGSSNGNPRQHLRPNALISRPSANLDVSASNRYEKYRNYPSFTTSSSSSSTATSNDELFKPSGSEQSAVNNDYYDINHPRMHNLLGLLMKSKQLPRGRSPNYYREDEEQRGNFYDDERRRIYSGFGGDKNNDRMILQKRSNVPIDMGPPPADPANIRPRPARGGGGP